MEPKPIFYGPPIPESLQQPETVLDGFLRTIREPLKKLRDLEGHLTAGLKNDQDVKAILEEVSGLESLLAFAEALRDDLSSGPQLDFLGNEERSALQETLLRPTSEDKETNIENPSETELVGLQLVMYGLFVRAEMYPVMARESWKNNIQPDLERLRISLEELSEATGIGLDTLKNFQEGKGTISIDAVSIIGQYLFDKEYPNKLSSSQKSA